ncbi:hypothetical protein AB0K00_41775 [Dactylosporangium sp. NPDC049525]|uniref:hypothetical protein n=1 Tax=Dactylosporangium sp. NPDC049525 TaxID=3154730 RepID=UPI0034309E04
MSIRAEDADPAELPERLRELTGDGGGEFTASSDSALRLLTVAAQESAAGLDVDLDFLVESAGQADDYFDRVLRDTAAGDGGDANAFTWQSMMDGGDQDTGVAEAWRRLALTGRVLPPFEPVVPVVVIDDGFVRDADLPDVEAVSVRFDADGRTPQNVRPCSGGGSCPFHGNAVSRVLAARPNNATGVAGTGGLVVDLTVMPLGDVLNAMFGRRSSGCCWTPPTRAARTPPCPAGWAPTRPSPARSATATVPTARSGSTSRPRGRGWSGSPTSPRPSWRCCCPRPPPTATAGRPPSCAGRSPPATLPYVGNNVQARITVPRCVSPDVKVTVVAVDTDGNQFATDSVTVKVGTVPC